MLHVCKLFSPEANDCDYKIAITRKFDARKHPDYIWFPELSPSDPLFSYYMQNQHTWTPEKFQGVYVPWFLRDLAHNALAIDALNKLYAASFGKAEIALCCFCKDETACHRSIVAGLLQAVGAQITCTTGFDYRAYYTRYLQSW